MNKVLAVLVVLLGAVSTTAQNKNLLYPAMMDDDPTCVGAEPAIGGQTYTVDNGTPSQLLGPPSSPITSGPKLHQNLFYLAMTNDDLNCVGTELTIGGQTYTVKNGAASQLFGPTPSTITSGAQVPAKLRWYASGSCGGSTKDECTGQFTLAAGTGQVCSVQYAAHEGRILFYTVSQVTSGSVIYWSISFTSSHYTPGPL